MTIQIKAEELKHLIELDREASTARGTARHHGGCVIQVLGGHVSGYETNSGHAVRMSPVLLHHVHAGVGNTEIEALRDLVGRLREIANQISMTIDEMDAATEEGKT
jgi:hypothetical protein